MTRKKKILMSSDHPLSTSGVGTQARWLIHGLLDTCEYEFRCLGAAVKHSDYSVVNVPPPPGAKWKQGDFIVRPIDGFGNRDLFRHLLVTEKPDAILIFNDPRFFMWLWEFEEEIHQVCPIAYWHVWDNDPWPAYNHVLYDSTDLVNCHSYLTYEMVKKRFPEKTNFIPHALPRDIFYPFEEARVMDLKKKLLGPERADHFVGLWINRNAKRKRSNDVLVAWKLFMDMLQEKHGHQKATLIMHTDPFDDQGANLLKTSELLGTQKSVVFSKDRVDFAEVAALHNISDFTLNVSCNEGFGLGTLESMQCGKPIIALKTGGLTRQVVDHRDGSENGIALPVELRTLVGSQLVCYIYEDYVTNETTAKAIFDMFEMGPEKRKQLGLKAREYVLSEFNLDKTINDWHMSLSALIDTWKTSRSKIYKPWDIRML
jgi:glycosyltransferase involved in cell wall biosynthesis